MHSVRFLLYDQRMKKILSILSVSLVATACTMLLNTYTDSDNRWSIQYPTDLVVRANNEIITEDYQSTGTSFIFPQSYSEGNTLYEGKISVSLRATCSTIEPTSPQETVDINGVEYKKHDWSGAGAGNLYEGTTYMTTHNDRCYVFSLYMHSCNLGQKCAEGHREKFNKRPLEDIFEDMMDTVSLL